MSSTRSKVLQRAAIVVLAAVGAALPQLVIAQSDALVGKWILVPERSKYSGPERYKSMTLTFSKAASGMTQEVEGVDAKGNPIKGTLEVVDDNKSRPATGLADYDAAKWQKLNDNQALFMYERRRNTVAIGTRTLGNGGKSLTYIVRLAATMFRWFRRTLLSTPWQTLKPRYAATTNSHCNLAPERVGRPSLHNFQKGFMPTLQKDS